jgi:hypothetical protein
MRLYYHKTDGGAEYLMDAFLECKDGHREGVFEGAKFIVRIDGNITKDAELTVRETVDEKPRGAATSNSAPGGHVSPHTGTVPAEYVHGRKGQRMEARNND